MTCLKVATDEMNKRVTLQTSAQVPDGQGGFTESWTAVKQVWASITPVKGYEKFQAMKTMTPVTHKVTLRYDPAVTTAKRFLWGTRVFEIKECLNMNERGVFLQLLCLEVT